MHCMIVYTLLTITSNSLLQGLQAQRNNSSCNATLSLEALGKVLENLQKQIQLHETKIKRLITNKKWQEPVAVFTSNQTIVEAKGNDVKIWCVVRGTPLPEIRWMRQNGTLETNRVEYGSNGETMRIKDVGWSDAGTYICVAANGIGTQLSQSFNLIIGPPLTGLFATTSKGLIFLNLRTLEATALTSTRAFGVAVNQKLKKVYWSEQVGILRSNFDGSDKEIIVSNTDDSTYNLAINEASGNIYYTSSSSQEITVCNALGKYCDDVISESGKTFRPLAITLDSENGNLYWSYDALFLANLDGSNLTVISKRFINFDSMALEHGSDSLLYWTDSLIHTIGTIDVKSGNKRTLVELHGSPAPKGIQVDAHKIYIGNWYAKNIQSFDRVSGKGFETIFNSTGYVDKLALLNPSS